MKFLICGMGSIGVRHFKNLKSLGYNDIILYSSGKSTYPDLDKIVEATPSYTSLQEALSKKPDVCMITNPTSMHIDIAIQAAQSNCHLYIEKPVSNNLDRLDELNRLIDEKNLISFVTYQFRFHPHIEKLKTLITQQDKFGTVAWARAEWSEYLPDWHPWENYKKGYSARRELGGGVLLTQIHPLNYLGFLFGEISSLNVNAQSTGLLDIEVDDVADINVRFQNNIIANIHIDFIQKPRIHMLTIVTNKGRFEWDCHKNLLQFLDHDGHIKNFSNSNFARNDMFVAMLKEYIGCVNQNVSSRFTVKQATEELSLLLENIVK